MAGRFGVEIEVCGFSNRGFHFPWTAAAEHLNYKPDGCGGNFTVICEGMNNYGSYESRQSWKTVQEFSVSNGFELVSPILTCDEQGFTKIRTMMSHLREAGCTMSLQCGQHVHIDATFLRGYSDYHLEKFFQLLIDQYAQHEEVFDTFVKTNRRQHYNIYCKSMKNKTIRHVYSNREHKLNLNSFFKYGSIEFRQLHGTLNGDVTVAWTKLCQNFLEKCRQHYESTNDLSVTPYGHHYANYRDYYLARRAA